MNTRLLLASVTIFALYNETAAEVPLPVTSKKDAVTRARVNIGQLGANGMRYELPAASMRTGPHDFYSLFATNSLGSASMIYGIGISTEQKRMASADARISTNNELLNVQIRQQIPAGFGRKVEYIEAKFDRAFLERAANKGTRLSVISSRGPFEFSVPDWMFGALIEVADEHDYKRKADREEQARKEAEGSRRQLYLDAHADAPDRVKKAIANGKIILGMSSDETRASWGSPEKINRTVTIRGAHEQWIYGNTYVYFDDGILTSWQDSR